MTFGNPSENHRIKERGELSPRKQQQQLIQGHEQFRFQVTQTERSVRVGSSGSICDVIGDIRPIT